MPLSETAKCITVGAIHRCLLVSDAVLPIISCHFYHYRQFVRSIYLHTKPLPNNRPCGGRNLLQAATLSPWLRGTPSSARLI